MAYRSVFLLVLFLSGCANVSTISRRTQLDSEAMAIHLDSAQRLVYRNKMGMLCAEPTPDALQSYANGFGGSLTGGGREAASLSNAFTANALGVGLHTQSITLMRDILYRICEQSHNDNLSRLDVMQLLQRAQDLTLGVLAIEQLTGAVSSRQPVMINNSSANSASVINDTQAQLEIAKAREDARKSESEAAALAETNAKAAAGAAKALLDEEKAKDAANQDAAKVKELQDRLSALERDLNSKAEARLTAEAGYKAATAARKAIEGMAVAAVANSAASTGGTAAFSDLPTRAHVDKDTVAKISEATVQIVKYISGKGHLTDSCMNFFQHSANTAKRLSDVERSEISTLCSEVIKADIRDYTERREKAAKEGLTGGPSTTGGIGLASDPNLSTTSGSGGASGRTSFGSGAPIWDTYTPMSGTYQAKGESGPSVVDQIRGKGESKNEEGKNSDSKKKK